MKISKNKKQFVVTSRIMRTCTNYIVYGRARIHTSTIAALVLGMSVITPSVKISKTK